jgi:hypothetical protein
MQGKKVYNKIENKELIDIGRQILLYWKYY